MNYLKIDSNGVQKDYNFVPMTAGNNVVNKIIIMADFDEGVSTPYAVTAFVKRNDGMIVGPVNVVEVAVPTEFVGEYTRARVLVLTDKMLAVEGAVEFSLYYNKLESGEVVSTMVPIKNVLYCNESIRLFFNDVADYTSFMATINAHINDTANPHVVTRAQLDLENVANYGVATQGEAEAGTADNKYMTPLKSRQGFLKMKSGLFDNEQRYVPVNNEKYVTPAVLNDFTNGHLQFGPGKPTFDRKLSDLIWIINDSTSQLAFKKAGIIYRVDEAFTTTSDFVEGAGFSYPKDTLIRMVQIYGGAFKYTVYNLATDINFDSTRNVKQAIEDLENKLLQVYKPKGTLSGLDLETFILGNDLSVNVKNFVYNAGDAFTTTDAFLEGAGTKYPAGTNIAVIEIEGTPNTYMLDILGGIYNKAEDIIYNDSNVKDEITNLKTTKAETIETSVTIDTTDWVADGVTSTYKAVKTVSGVLASDNPIISFDLTGIADTAWTASRTEFAKIGLASTTDDDEITFYASAIPSEDITVTVKVVR